MVGVGKITEQEAVEILEDKNVNVSALFCFLGDDTIYVFPVTSRDDFPL